MDINTEFLELVKLGGKFIAHRYQQYRLATNEYEVANTSCGQVRGRKRKNLHEEFGMYSAFEGIPYAKKPLGELRFRAPQAAEAWSEILECTNYKPKAMQYDYVSKRIEGSEDCLYLNVYAKTVSREDDSKVLASFGTIISGSQERILSVLDQPNLFSSGGELTSEKPLPVMVWIYGGGFQIGEATRDLYAPDYLMQRDVILVTFNYRLGIFGFMCMDDPDLKIPGNAGLKDQVLALKWVKENIHNFNGDPNNITVFGESAGGASTHLLMLSPQAKDLFHKAIIQSASVLCPWVLTERHDYCYKLAHHIGYTGEDNDKDVYSFLMAQPATALTFKDENLMTKEDLMSNLIIFFGPVIEPYTMHDCIADRPFREMLPTAWGNKIPLIIGANSSEGLLFYNTAQKYTFLIDELTDLVNLLPDDILSSYESTQLKEKASKLRDLYFSGAQPNIKDHFFQYLDLMGHRTFWHSVVRTIKARSAYAAHAPTFCYQFDFDSSFLNHFRILKCGRSVRGVSHADDLPYLFYSVMSPKLATNSREFKCVQRIVGMWHKFALTSNPNCEECEPVVWQPVDETLEPVKCLNISDDVEFKDLPIYDKLKVWDGFYTKGDII